MRHDEDALAEGEQIHVDRAGTPTLRPDPPELLLYRPTGLEQSTRLEVGPDLDHRVEERRLRWSDGLGLVHAGGPHDHHAGSSGEETNPAPQVLEAVPEVRARGLISADGRDGVPRARLEPRGPPREPAERGSSPRRSTRRGGRAVLPRVRDRARRTTAASVPQRGGRGPDRPRASWTARGLSGDRGGARAGPDGALGSPHDRRGSAHLRRARPGRDRKSTRLNSSHQ